MRWLRRASSADNDRLSGLRIERLRVPSFLLLLRRSVRPAYRRRLVETLTEFDVEFDPRGPLDDLECAVVLLRAGIAGQSEVLRAEHRVLEAERRVEELRLEMAELRLDLRVLLDDSPVVRGAEQLLRRVSGRGDDEAC